MPRRSSRLTKAASGDARSKNEEDSEKTTEVGREEKCER